MEGIKYVNLIEIDPVIIEIHGVENGELAVPVNNTFVSHTVFLAADTRPCVLIIKLATLVVLAYAFSTLGRNSFKVSIYNLLKLMNFVSDSEY